MITANTVNRIAHRQAMIPARIGKSAAAFAPLVMMIRLPNKKAVIRFSQVILALPVMLRASIQVGSF